MSEPTNLRVPPQATDVEQAVLCAMMLDKQAIARAIETIDETFFYKDSHRKIYLTLVELFDRREAADLFTMTEFLKKNSELDHVGGPNYLAEVGNVVPSSANIEHHLKIIREKAVARKLIYICDEIVNNAYEQKQDTDELLDSAERSIFEISESRIKKGFENINPILHTTFERIEELHHTSGTGVTGLPSGYTALDEKTAGFQRSDFIVIAGRPSMGKTAFALNVMRHVAVEKKSAVGFFSLEMSAEALVLRLLCAESGVDQMKVRRGKLSNDELKRLSTYVAALHEAEIYIDDSPGLSILELRSKARRLVSEKNIQLFIVDYLQLMEVPKQENRQQEISKISRSLKALAKELNIPIVALSQLSRAVETRDKSRRPQLSDLRESGAIEQDADLVMFVYRPEYYDIPTFEDTGASTYNVCEIIIGKQRNGPTGAIKLTFRKEYGQFQDYIAEEAAVISAEDF